MYYIDNFEKYLINEKHTAKATAAAYLADIDDYEQFIKNRNRKFENASFQDVDEYLKSLTACGKSASTINRRLASVRAFYKYLLQINAVKKDPASGIKPLKVAQQEIVYLAQNEIVKLIESPDTSVNGLRDRALMELMYATGIRASEVCMLNLDDVNYKIGFISISSADKTRMVPLGKPCRDALSEYIEKSRNILLSNKKDCGALFLNYIGDRITRQGIWKILKNCAEKSGFEKEISPQIIRNTFAAHLIQNGADLKSLQELLGHEDIMATKIYLSVTKNRILDVYDKAFPRA